MALSQVEKALCWQAAIGQDLRGHGWGSPTMGYCPIGAVVAHRGGHLYVGPDGCYTVCPPPNAGRFCCRIDRLSSEELAAYRALEQIVHVAETDVLGWSGYATVGDMTTALLAQGVAALPGA